MIEAFVVDPEVLQRLGEHAKAISDFRSGFGNFNSTQNAFLVGPVAMVQQGPWMSNYIENLKPAWNRWRMPEEKLELEKKLARCGQGHVAG